MSVTRFGQLVIGPPGSGKTTYVKAMSELLKNLGRKIAIINLGEFSFHFEYRYWTGSGTGSVRAQNLSLRRCELNQLPVCNC